MLCLIAAAATPCCSNSEINTATSFANSASWEFGREWSMKISARRPSETANRRRVTRACVLERKDLARAAIGKALAQCDLAVVPEGQYIVAHPVAFRPGLLSTSAGPIFLARPGRFGVSD